jgi:3-hydroxyacyl-[acyl-carrier-protein] dehydratase
MTQGMDIQEILKRLPHRFPFLLVDKIVSYVPGESLVAVKNVTFNEPFFTGHFPERPVMPGVLIIESLAQACALLNFKTHDVDVKTSNFLFYLVGVEDVRFKRIVEPGDQLFLHVKDMRKKRDLWMFSTHAEVNGEVACTAEIYSIRKDLNT